MSILKDVIDHLKSEWVFLKSSPVAFIITLLLCFVCSFFVMKWRYDGIIEQLHERLELNKERLQIKNDQLDEYRQRLHLVPVSGTSFSRMSNKELKGKTLDVILGIREFLNKVKNEDRQISDQEWNKVVSARQSAKSEEDKERIWKSYSSKVYERILQREAQYYQNFKVDAILLRDEILSRLPKSVKNEKVYIYYERSFNIFETPLVADDLERLAKSLP